MAKKVGMLVDLEFCVGCYACQSACQDYNDLDLGITYLRVINYKPDEVDGELMMFMAPIPYKLEQCAACVEKEGEAPCAKICIAKALYIDEVEKLTELAEGMDRRTCLFR